MTSLLNVTNIAALAVALAISNTGHANPENFTVHSVTGTNIFTLAAAKGKFVALHFLLKTECPYCLRHTHEYAQKAAADSNVLHVFLKPDTETEIKTWATKLVEDTLKLPIFRDPDAALAKSFKIPDGYKFHGQSVHFPALVLLDASGKEVFRYVGKSNADRLSYEKFTAKLEELTKPSSR
jgi:peroxiredoxin Q/BCP